MQLIVQEPADACQLALSMHASLYMPTCAFHACKLVMCIHISSKYGLMQVPDEAPSSVNIWSHLPSPSNIQSSQSSVLDGLGSSALPIEQLQLKGNLPGLTLPHQLPAPWGIAPTDNSPPVPSQAPIAMQGSSQTPWLPAWSQDMLHQPATGQVSNHANDGQVGLKRTCSPDENGEPVDSKLSKRPKLHGLHGCNLEGYNTCGLSNQQMAQHTKREGVLKEAKDNNEDTGSPNTSSHSSSPEAAVIEPDCQVAAAQRQYANSC